MDKESLVVIKKYALGLALLILVSLFFTDALFVRSEKTLRSSEKTCVSMEVVGEPETPMKLSQIKVPRIDDQAASISCQDSSEVAAAAVCRNLPGNILVFLLFAYLVLLIFNLAYDFERTAVVRWKFEAILTAIFVFGWAYFDNCFSNLWFPLYIIKLGILIFVIYLYFFEKNKKASETAM
jgi:hypothetical protein